MLSFISAGIIACLPATYELDFDALPPPNVVKSYSYTIVLSFKGKEDTKLPLFLAKDHSQTAAADQLLETLDDPRWKIKRDGNRITILGYDDVKTARITVEGKGPQPLVRRVIALPTPKKP
jgi:hypothetical protein